MATDTSEIRSTLNGLIETLKDSEEGFRTSAESINNAAVRSQFHDIASQRAGFAAELQNQVSRIGGTPETGGSAMGALHRGWIGLKSAITGKDDHAILEEAERGEDSAVKNYRDAMAKDLPRDIHALIEDQYSSVLNGHNRIKALRDGTATIGTRSETTY